MENDSEYIALIERTFTAEQRKALADSGKAMPDGSYPIENASDLSNAIQAIGRATNPAAVKAHIIKMAKAMGKMDMLPDDWKAALKEAEELDADADNLNHIAEAGRVLSASNRHIVEEIMGHAQKLAHHPTAIKIEEMCKQLLAAAEFKESISLQIIEAAGKKDGREWDVLLIQAGLSENGRYYPADTLRKAAPLFEGVASYADHATDAERQARPERSIKDKVGKFTHPEFGNFSIRGRMIEGIKARFKVVASWLKEALLEADSAGEPDFFGFSIDAEGKVTRKEQGGKMVSWVEAITRVNSVDVVTMPAAGGQIVRLVASAANNNAPEGAGGIDMDPEEIRKIMQEAVAAAVEPLKAEITALKEVAPPPPVVDEETRKGLAELREAQRKADNERRMDKALDATKLSEIGKARMRAQLVDASNRRDVPEEELTAAIKEAIDYEAHLAQPGSNPSATERAHIGDTSHDKMVKALTGMFEGEDVDGVPRFRSIKESYCRWYGTDAFDTTAQEIHRAFVATRYDSAVDHKRLKESLQTSSWADVYGDVMYVKLLKEYKASNYGVWRRLCSDIVDVSDFRTQHWVRVGGYADLATVAETGTYPQLTSPGDEEIEFAIHKTGGLDDVTFEAIVNDRIGAIRRIPTNMARAAARTLYKFVMNLATTDNPTMDYDSTVLHIAAGHANLGTAALSLDGLNTSIIAMRDQTAYSETSEILGARNYPKFLIVPNELEQRANRIVNPTGSYTAMILDSDAGSSGTGTGIDPEAFKGKGIEVLVYDQFTDANDWYLVANPSEVNTIVMGFLNGQQEPELFVQDQPTVGSVFTADKISYKVRQTYGGDCIDHRSFYRNTVT